MASAPKEQPGPEKPAKRPQPRLLQARPAWLPPDYLPADATAIKALAAGTADPDQQKRALRWIIESAAGTYDLSYRPGGEDGRRDSDFAEGRRFVGSQIVKMLKINVAALLSSRKPGQPSEHE